MAIQHEVACTVQLPVLLCKQKIECIHGTLLTAVPLDKSIKYSIMVIGLGTGGHIVSMWIIGILVQHENKIPLSLCKTGIGASRDCINEASEECTNEMNFADKNYYISVETCFPKYINSNDLGLVTSIAAMPTRNHVSFCQQSEDSRPGSSHKTPAYDFSMCHSNGVLNIWKISDSQESFIR